MQEKKSFEEPLKLTKLSLILSGITINRTTWNYFVKFFVDSCLFYCNFIWLYTDVFGEIYWLVEGIQIGKSLTELSLTAPCTAICLLATSKSGPLYFNRETVVQALDKLREIHPEYPDDEEDTTEESVTNNVVEKEIVKDSIKSLNSIIRIYSYTCAPVVVAFSLMSIITMLYKYYMYGEFEIIFPFFIKYFFDTYTRTRWPFVYFHQVWSSIVCVNVFGADSLFYALCTYINMNFRILCHRFENSVPRYPGDVIITRKRFFESVKRHQDLIHLVDQVETLYTKSILFNISTSSVLICLSGFNVTSVDDVGAVVSFVTFLVLSLSQIFLLCYFGDMIMRSSTEVSQAIYNCSWYNADESMKKCVLLILMRSQKPCKLTAAKFADLNLRAYTTILSRSWSYFALLKTMYK